MAAENCCPACGTHDPVKAEALARVQLLEDAQTDLQNDLIVARAKNTRLRNDRNERKLQDPLMALGEPLFDHWREKLSPMAREFTGKRRDAVIARLRAVPQEELGDRVALITRAIDGAAKLPYVTALGRAPSGKPEEKQTELELICRTEAHLHRFASYQEPPPEPTMQPTHTPSPNGGTPQEAGGWQPTPLDRIAAVLQHEFGRELVGRNWRGPVLSSVSGPCPLHPSPYPDAEALIVRADVHGGTPIVECGQGCLPSKVFEKLRELERLQLDVHVKEKSWRKLIVAMGSIRWQWLVDRQVAQTQPELLSVDEFEAATQ